MDSETRADFDTEAALASNPFWYCEVCESQNSRLDGECQFCEPPVFGESDFPYSYPDAFED